ncbi:hypothetical protein ANRL4_04953 [Anaerolineae bacterium]|nr:hypothetical protein ANRL4_04953 [Anaerolineae bacterium]
MKANPFSNQKFPDANKTQLTAMYIAMVVRNAMEDFHHDHLTDDQMAELNPIIRNAIYTALYVMDRRHKDLRCLTWFKFTSSLIPSYWELPKLIDEFANDPIDRIP